MSDEIVVGDRVVLVRADNWCQPLRKYGEDGKKATVESIFVPMGSTQARYRVRFDLKRYANDRSGVHFLSRGDLQKVSPE